MPRPIRHCQACGAAKLVTFHERHGVPVHVAFLAASASEARGVPRGDLHLALCSLCGFIQNRLYDSELSGRTASLQPAPERDRQLPGFLTTVSERYGGTNQTALRLPEREREGVRIPQTAGAGLATAGSRPPATLQKADIVTFRNQLDRVLAVREVLDAIRRGFGDEREPVLVMEVSDVRRVLAESAPWELHYQWPSLFSAGSLARLVRSCDFEIFGLHRTADQQALVIEAAPGNSGEGDAPWEMEEDLTELRELTSYFQHHHNDRLAEWQTHLWRVKRGGGRAVLWGCEPRAVSFLDALGRDVLIDYVVDPDPRTHGRFLPGSGAEVAPPEFLRDYRPSVVIATDVADAGEIDNILTRLGITPAITAL